MKETDLEIAHRIGTIAVKLYGEGGEEEAQVIRLRGDKGIWNDHPAVQAVLMLLKEQDMKGGDAS